MMSYHTNTILNVEQYTYVYMYTLVICTVFMLCSRVFRCSLHVEGYVALHALHCSTANIACIHFIVCYLIYDVAYCRLSYTYYNYYFSKGKRSCSLALNRSPGAEG